MAAYSDNREQNLEMKYLRKQLGEVDKSINLPESLSGQSLLPSLDGVQQNPPPMSVALVRPNNWLNTRSWFAYAASFLLLVGIFYAFGLDKQNHLIDGTITLEKEMEDAGKMELKAENASSASAYSEQSNQASAVEDEDKSGAKSSDAKLKEPTSALSRDDSSNAAHKDAEHQGVPDAVGGILSTQLCEFGDDYILAYRPVDESDPDIDASNVIEIIDTLENRLISLIPLPAMDRVLRAFAEDNMVAIIGEDDDFVHTLVIDLSNLEEPSALEAFEQPGKLKDARRFENIVHIVSYTAQPVQSGIDAVSLPHSSEDGTAIFSALNLSTASKNQVAFQGSGKDIKIYNLSAYIYYNGVSENDEQLQDLYVAQVKFDDLEMQLGGIS